MRNPHAGQPFTTSDEEIARTLLDVSIPTLMLSLVHMSGDPELIRGALRPAGLFLNEVQGYMSEDDKAAVRTLALTVIADYRDRGCPEPQPVGAELLKEMMEWLVCEPVPDEYVPMVLEEMELDGLDVRAVRATDAAGRDAESTTDFPVLVIGCGESGLLAGIRLKEAGIPFTIIERAAGVGGTWWHNSYPGARVDVGNHFYCYSFEPSDHWTQFFAEQPELQAYFERILDKYEIRPHVRFETEVTGATWDEATATWQVAVRGPDGSAETVSARAVISAVGQLNRPYLPPIPGRDDFDGPSFHSAEWDHDVDVTGKRVAMIGAGASGFQIAPSIADKVASLNIFQRTAQWMFPNPNYHEKVGDGVKWALKHLPFYGRWYRFLLFWPGCDKGLAAARVDPDYPDQGRAVSEINDVTRIMFTEWIKGQIGDNPDLLAKVIPDYPATGKRTLQDNGSWLQTLTQDHVELIRTPIARIERGAVVTADEQRHPADVIVYATGFHAGKVLWPMAVVGRDGRVLAEQWGERPTAYLGITVPGFPNFFCMYGPGTNLASGGSLIFHSECQMRYISTCLELLLSGHGRWMEPRQERLEDWVQRSQAEMRTMVWSQPSIRHSFYKNADGDVYTLSPWRLVDYWTWTRNADPEDYTFG